ncbi:helicase-related protein [Actinomadura opuntiae]|uniref:helicase-related protein n=1 Tax=Actinomadura sp. OS1-43 TaxID=604315 RepID=UPI00255B0DD7|nr:helicase-related protein [Actinomadura sp. OS1-43]MDL4816939.1 helicase-related protein [Actinomadura sp. OS1-43]
MRQTFHGSREHTFEALSRELFGPGPERSGKPLDLSRAVHFPSWEAARGVWHDAASGQEILTEVVPSRRYGVGILFPGGTLEERSAGPGLDVEHCEEPQLPDADIESKQAKIASRDEAGQDDDLDLSLANVRLPSTLGLSVHGSFPAGSRMVLTAEVARYRSFEVAIAEGKRDWWVREPVTIRATFRGEDLAVTGSQRQRIDPYPQPELINAGGFDIEVRAYSRMVQGDHLITVTLTNRSHGGKDGASLFQAGFELSAESGGAFLPYPERPGEHEPDDEEATAALLYRHHRTFALGHGCAADWEREPGEYVGSIRATCLPSFEAPSITPDIQLPDSSRLEVSMEALAAEDRQHEASRQVSLLVAGYRDWISGLEEKALELPREHRPAAERHIADCKVALERVERGWALIRRDRKVALAFRLANEAMLVQQARSAAPLRQTVVDKSGLVQVLGEFPTGELPPGRGKWRPFQIAFLLAVAESVADPTSTDRDTVELIFFPTGGGKTEAYLAVAAFSLFLRRLRDPSDAGTDVIMRYTLRLLTAQQFLRAASLICAMEYIRARRSDLGGEPYSIGVWLGGGTTPNSRKGAIRSWDDLARNPGNAANDFLLLRCPWCAARMGPTEGQLRSTKGSKAKVIPGYHKHRSGVTLRCPDSRCSFHDGLPMLVVDDDIYDKPPSMIIGTVDKFATMAWKPDSRAIFGLDRSGERRFSPPGLIIQDEFHLISGPLGSMVGLYESVVEDLCTDRCGAQLAKPKIIASTATIRRYREQVAGIYARDRVALFPPHGLDASDSFFSVWARDGRGKLLPGRRYVGVHAPALGSMQSVQVRTAAALLQAPLSLPDEQRDPWWSSLWFFNSLRELGNSLSLLQADIPDYLVGLRRRDGLEDIRFARSIMELTGRRRNDEIPRAIEELSTPYGEGRAVDICLSSNIIEVGVDIDRLSLMVIVGQPKTTAQYIQVSGRVGRRWEERPGLVVTLYGAAKPRDRSHYERFRTYHERLYAQVEPTSVTPFAEPVMKRALHGALVAHIRLTNPDGLQPWPLPGDAAGHAARILLERARQVDPEEAGNAKEVIEQRLREWKRWERSEWEADTSSGDPLNGLMRYAGSPAPGKQPATSWEVPASMRNVDAECKAAITRSYNRDDEVQEDGQ